jgi:hypothetical protein
MSTKQALEIMLLQAMTEEGETMTEASWQRLRKDAAARVSELRRESEKIQPPER